MARVVVLGAGVSGHTAALHLRRLLPKQHEVMVVSPNANWNWIPSNIWVGVGRMTPKQVTFPLAPVYRRQGITGEPPSLRTTGLLRSIPEWGGKACRPREQRSLLNSRKKP